MRSGQTAESVLYEGFFYAHKDRVAIIMACLLSVWVLFGFYNAGVVKRRETFTGQFARSPRPSMDYSECQNHAKVKGSGVVIAVTLVGLVLWSVFAEMHLMHLPQSEDSDAVGQWGPLVASLLVGCGAWIKARVDRKGNVDAELGQAKGDSWVR